MAYRAIDAGGGGKVFGAIDKKMFATIYWIIH